VNDGNWSLKRASGTASIFWLAWDTGSDWGSGVMFHPPAAAATSSLAAD
jgi:hypothetical protein